MKFLDNVRIGRKVGGGFGVVLALIVALGAFAIWSNSNIGSLFSEYRQLARTSVELSRLRGELQDMRLASKSFIQTGKAEFVEDVKTSGAAAQEAAERAKEIKDTPEERAWLDARSVELGTYMSEFEKAVALQAERNRQVATLDTVGPEIEKMLTGVMSASAEAGNSVAALRAGQSLRNLLLARLYVTKYLVSNEESDRQRVLSEMEAFDSDLSSLKAALVDPSQTAQVDGAIEAMKGYAAAFNATHQAITARNAIFRSQLDVIGPNVAEQVTDKTNAAKARQDELGPQATASIGFAETLIVITTVIVLALGALAAWILARGIAGPIIRMTKAMQRLADKDTGVEIPAVDNRDEVGEMGRAVLVFKENMIRADALAEEQAREREGRERRAARIEELNRSFDSGVREVLDTVGTAVDELQRTAQAMSSIAEETSNQASAVAAASEQSSTSVQTVSSAAEELSSSIQEISRQIAQSSELAGSASRKATSTQEIVAGLSASVDRIGDIVRLISDVAEQTNLLALNATIEAARAGEAGKGFAVVATEVKNLASQTAKATEDISRQIGEVQAETMRAVPAIDEIVKAIEEVNQVASSIAGAVEEQAAATGEIAENVQQAADGAGEISRNITGVTQASTEASGASTQVLASSERLADQSEKLREMVRKFIGDVQAA